MAAQARRTPAGNGRASARITCLGEALIDFVATRPGLTLLGEASFVPAPGGAPANVAVGAARLGGASAFVGRVGADEFGRAIAGELARNGVDIAGLRFDQHAPTRKVFVLLDEAGERSFHFSRQVSADTQLTPSDVDAKQIQSASVLHVGSLSLSAEPSASATWSALRIAAEAGVPRSCDVNLREALWSSQEHMVRQTRLLIAECDVVKANEEEAALLTGETSAANAARCLQAMGPWLAVVTSSSDGATFAMGVDVHHVPGFPQEAVDTTGAGDAFMAALLVELVVKNFLGAARPDSTPISDAISVANAAGALATTAPGAIPALPTRFEVAALAGTRSVRFPPSPQPSTPRDC